MTQYFLTQITDKPLHSKNKGNNNKESNIDRGSSIETKYNEYGLAVGLSNVGLHLNIWNCCFID